MKEFFDRIKSLNILVIGDVMLDRYVIGEVKRISPEAPVPVLAVREEKSVAGGAANVALNLKALGANVETIGWFGNDKKGDELFDILGRRNIGDAVIISDYGKGFVTNQLLELVSVNAKFLAIDPKPSRLLQYAKPDLITPNRFEALELAGLSRESRDPFPQENVVNKIFEQFAPTMLAVTLGADGMLLAEDGEIDKIIPTSAQEVFDVSGAGDTVIAALTLGLVAGKDFQNAAEFANLAAGVVVGKVGTATVSPEEILSLVD